MGKNKSWFDSIGFWIASIIWFKQTIQWFDLRTLRFDPDSIQKF